MKKNLIKITSALVLVLLIFGAIPTSSHVDARSFSHFSTHSVRMSPRSPSIRAKSPSYHAPSARPKTPSQKSPATRHSTPKSKSPSSKSPAARTPKSSVPKQSTPKQSTKPSSSVKNTEASKSISKAYDGFNSRSRFYHSPSEYVYRPYGSNFFTYYLMASMWNNANRNDLNNSGFNQDQLLNPAETTYWITVHTDSNEDIKVLVTKSQFDKIQKGDSIEVKNSKLYLNSKELKS